MGTRLGPASPTVAVASGLAGLQATSWKAKVGRTEAAGPRSQVSCDYAKPPPHCEHLGPWDRAPALNLNSYSAFQRTLTSAPVRSLATSLLPLHGPGRDKQALGPVLSPTAAATEAPN